MKITQIVAIGFGALNSGVFGDTFPTFEARKAKIGARGNASTQIPLVKMKWMGHVFPGGDIVELEGNAQDIYDQIMELNPDYSDCDDFLEGRFPAVGILKRDMVECFVGYDPSVYGGNDNAINTSLQILQIMGGVCTIPAGTCTELQCQSWSGRSGGVYGCNRNADKDITLPCKNYGAYAKHVMESCAPIFYKTPNGRAYNLHDGAYSNAAAQLDVYVQRCSN